jgi:hypothetical protein
MALKAYQVDSKTVRVNNDDRRKPDHVIRETKHGVKSYEARKGGRRR